MWRQNIYKEKQDSDGSISDDDEEDIIRSRNRNRNPSVNPKNSIPPRKINQVIEREFDSMNQAGTSTWSSVLEETNELMRLQENRARVLSHSSNYEAKRSCKGSTSKFKPRFSFGFHSDREASLPLTAMDNTEKPINVHRDLEGLDELEPVAKEHSMMELLEGLQSENRKQSVSHQVSSELSTGGHGYIEHPISELLEDLLENHGPLRGTPNMTKEAKGKRSTLSEKRSKSYNAYRALEEEDHSEPMDSTTSSDEEVAKGQLQAFDQGHLKSTTAEISGQTMADKFQEALNAASVSDQGAFFPTSNRTGIGYFGRLQLVLQTEKEVQTEFLSRSREGIGRDIVGFIDVQILSRYLDAKLTVCNCLLGAVIKSTQSAQSFQKNTETEEKRTIIFISRTCNNVELEVGKFVRIHPPWKEVEITKKEAGIILCTYFSQISV